MHRNIYAAETADVHGPAMTSNGLCVNDDLHGLHVELLLLILKHGQWLSVATIATMMDHLHDMAFS